MKHLSGQRILWALLFLLALVGCQSAPQEPVFDVPALVGQKFDAVQQKLGAPTQTTEADPLGSTFERGGYTLLVHHLAHNGRITEFVLSPPEPVKDENQDEILRTGRLREGDPRYSIEWIEDPNEVLKTAGVRVVPAPRKYNVTLRIRSNAPLISVRVTGASSADANSVGANGSVFQTIPPYEHSFEAQTGEFVGIEAAPFQTRDVKAPANLQTSVEVVVNGKVVAQNATAGRASAQFELE